MSGSSRLSARARVTLAASAVLAIAVLSLVIVAYWATSSRLVAASDAVLTREADAYAAAMAGAPDDAALAEATRAYLSERTVDAGVDPLLMVAFDSGRTISNSEIRLEDAPGNRGLTDPQDTADFGEVSLDGVTYRVLSVPVLSAGVRVGTFQAALDSGLAAATAQRVALSLLAAGLIALALGVFLAEWATRQALEPLTRMADDARTISHVEPGRRIAYDGPPDELGTLASALNDMLDRLERSYDDQRRFVADASHELRTPVAIVRGNVEVLRASEPSDADLDESLEAIEDEAVRMTRLLDEMLSLARLESTGRREFQPLDAATIVEEVASRGRSLGKRRFETEGTCDLWFMGDPDLLDQAMVNLVKNAIAHTSEDGVITLGCSASGDRVCLSVTDDGPGIPEGDTERVFDRFYRAQGPRPTDSGGAGLGLAITKRLVEVHGGEIRAENVSPHGAKFVIELPRIDEPA